MKYVRIALLLGISTVAGLLTWRKVEEKQLRDDLWLEAEEKTR